MRRAGDSGHIETSASQDGDLAAEDIAGAKRLSEEPDFVILRD